MVDADVLANLRRVDVDMDEAGVLGVGGLVAGRPVGEAHAYGDDQIGAGLGQNRGFVAVHAGHAEVARMRGRYRGQPHHRATDDRVNLLGEAQQLITGSRGDHAATTVDVGALGCFYHLGCRCQLGNRGQGRSRQRQRLGWSKLSHGGLDVFGDVYQHRAGPAAGGNHKGFGQNAGQLADVADDEAVLGDRDGDADDVHFLEAVLAQQRRGDIAGDCHQRYRVQVGGGDAGDQVGGAGARGRNHHADPPGGAGIAVGGMRRALLVRRDDMLDLVGVLVKLVVDVQYRAARVAKHHIDAMPD